MDDLFGIRSRHPFLVRYKKENVMIESDMGDWLAAFKLPVSFTQPELSVTTGKILGASDSGTLTLSLNIGTMPHSVRIRVLAPNGRELTHYGKILYLKNGTGQFVLRTAFNDPPGQWQVTAEEIISGKRAVHSFQLEPAK